MRVLPAQASATAEIIEALGSVVLPDVSTLRFTGFLHFVHSSVYSATGGFTVCSLTIEITSAELTE